MELISIIIPVYNVKDYLDACVESVCRQTYRNLEIILVDDGSTDGSGAMCDAWGEKDKRIIVIHQKNGGISAARNAGLDVAGGAYLGFVDSDDSIEPEMYERLYRELKASDCKIVMCSYRAVDNDGRECKRLYRDMPDGILTTEEYLQAIYANTRNRGTLVVVWNKLYKRELFQNVRFAENMIHEDEFLLNEILFQVDCVCILEAAYYNYYQRKGSTMHVEFTTKRLSYFYAVRDRLLRCVEHGFGKDCIRTVACNCMESGVKFWLIAVYRQIMSSDEEERFYRDVYEIEKKYVSYGSIKLRLLVYAFMYTPGILKGLYCTYKKLSEKKTGGQI